ncbi:MAG: hypothetical protein ACK5VI_10170 [Opitutia bacterium]
MALIVITISDVVGPQGAQVAVQMVSEPPFPEQAGSPITPAMSVAESTIAHLVGQIQGAANDAPRIQLIN